MSAAAAVVVVPGGGPQGSEVDYDTPPNAVAAQLRHVDTIDKSKPLLDPNVHVQKVRRKQSMSACGQRAAGGLLAGKACYLLGLRLWHREPRKLLFSATSDGVE